MESASGSRVEEQPPTLPVKLHRHSSGDSDCVFLQRQNSEHNDVFPEPTDCHAAQCPIHQRYDPSKHQERFFSDGTPPPVPRKKLTRTLSLPGTSALPLPPLSPLSPLTRRCQNFDNPVYMMAPIPDTCIQEETEDPVTSGGRPAAPLPSFSQLGFDTPDEHLSTLFRNFVDQHFVSERVQHRHLLFLRSVVQSVEEQNLLRVPNRNFSSFQPQDFLLGEGSKPRSIGDTTFYSLRSTKFPGRELSLRVLKRTNEAPPAHRRNQPPHVNVEEVIAFFQPGVLKNSTTQEPSPGRCATKSEHSSVQPAGGSSTQGSSDSVQSFLQGGLCVRVERDLPHATLEDFVEDSCSLQSSEGQDYDRQVCVLLLQILKGSHHLYNSSAAAADLRPKEILLVWSRWEGRTGGNLLRGGASKGQSSTQGDMKNMKRQGVQVFWKQHGSPRVVLMQQSPAFGTPQPLTSIKSQIGSLIQFCLRPAGSPKALDVLQSSYRRGLLHLSSVLQSENGPQMTEVMAMLQVLLWGPRVSLFGPTGPSAGAVQNWLTVKRALLVMKLAERALVHDQFLLDWEDCMCLKYLSFTDSETVVGVATQLWTALITESAL